MTCNTQETQSKIQQNNISMQCNIKVPKHQYLDVSRGISKLITYWNPVINCSTRSPGDNGSIICSRKEKFSISPVGRKRKETASQNSFNWNYCNKRVWSISSYPINFGVSTSKSCKLQMRYQKKSMHQILYSVGNEISFPNTYPLDSDFHLSVGFKKMCRRRKNKLDFDDQLECWLTKTGSW